MTGKIFLSGGGGAEQSKKLDRAFAKFHDKSRKLLYIPIAMPEKEHTYGACFDWIRSTLLPVGITRIDMWTDLEGRYYSDLAKYWAVYIGGGNTFYLMKKLKDTGFDKLLKKYWANGGIIYGGSAGAIILGKEIGTAYLGSVSDKNMVNLKNLNGLGIVGHAIHAHYGGKIDDNDIQTYVKKTKNTVIALSEDVGLFVHGKYVKVIGFKDAFMFNGDIKKALRRNP